MSRRKPISPDEVHALLRVDADAVRAELPQVEEHLAEFGDLLPSELTQQLARLKMRLS